MIGILIALIINTIVFAIAARAVPGVTIKGGAVEHVAVGAIYGLLMWAFGWCLGAVLVVGTGGLLWLFGTLASFLVVTLILVATDKLTDKLTIDGWTPVFITAAIMMGVQYVATQFVIPAIVG